MFTIYTIAVLIWMLCRFYLGHNTIDGVCKMQAGKITIEEIARQADVSIATVSRIINNKGPVADKTRQKVLDVMSKLNFHFQTNSALSDSESNVILMCIPEFKNPFYGTIVDGAQKAAQSHGYYILLMQSRNFHTDFADYERLLKGYPIAGMLLLSPVPSAKLIENLNFRCPIVMCSEYYEDSAVSFTSIDDKAAAKKAVQYLASIGCKKIAMLNSDLGYRWARHRERGFKEALKEAGLPVREDWIIHLPAVSFSLAIPNATYLLNQNDRPDGVFAVSDVYAAAAIKAASLAGLDVPKDISVVGFDNIDIALMSDPSITTIRQPSYDIGYQACEILVEKIEKPNMPPRQIILETDLIIRGSTRMNNGASS